MKVRIWLLSEAPEGDPAGERIVTIAGSRQAAQTAADHALATTYSRDRGWLPDPWVAVGSGKRLTVRHRTADRDQAMTLAIGWRDLDATPV